MLGNSTPPRFAKGIPPGFDPHARPGSHHVPNSYSVGERVAHTLLATALLAYGILGLAIDDLRIPGKRNSGVALHGVSAWLMFGAIVCGACVLLSLVVDHYDRRRNEHKYQTFKVIVGRTGGVFFGAAMSWHLWIAMRA